MFSAMLALFAPSVGGTLLICTIAHGLASGWLVDETTPATVAARVVLLWIPVVWMFWGAVDSSEKLTLCVFAVVPVAVPVILISLIGLKLSVALLLFVLLLFVLWPSGHPQLDNSHPPYVGVAHPPGLCRKARYPTAGLSCAGPPLRGVPPCGGS